MDRQRLVIGAALTGWAVAVAGGVAAVAGLALRPLPHVETTFDLGPAGMVSFVLLGISWATVGAVLVARRPKNRVGAFMVLIGAGYSLSITFGVIAFWAIADGDTVLAKNAGWLVVLTSSIGELTLYLAFIFPTGRGHTRGWDLAGRLFLAGLLVTMCWLLFQPGPMHLFPGVVNPVGFGPDLRPLAGSSPAHAVLALGLLAVPTVIAAVVARYRAADDTQRRQLKWVMSAIVVSVGALAVTGAAAVPGSVRSEAPITLYAVTGSLVAVAIGIAILRYHLYDIDRLISRTLSWALVSSVLAVLFVAALLVLQTALSGFTQSQTIAVAASTLVAIALFQPLRARVQRAVDRRFDRGRYDAQRTADSFANRLREEVDIDVVAADLEVTVGGAIHPATQGLWLRAAHR